MGSFFAPETDMIFGDGVGPPLICEVDVFLHWNIAAEEDAWVD